MDVATFWATVDTSSECWHWQGRRNRNGYGCWRDAQRRTKMAHRTAYELTHGPIPIGVLVCHRCDNRLCVRPDHLFLGTQAENIHDAITKGRFTRGERQHSAKLTADNVRELRQQVCAGVSTRQLAAQFGITMQNVRNIAQNKTWRHVH